jgi:ribosome-associated toxin RatA of RatAB toxin-antitoxin module
LLLLAVLPVTGETAQINVQTARHGNSFEIDATAEIDAGVAQAWKVLTDYDRLAEFIPGVQESRVVSREGRKVVVDQRGEARLLFFVFPMQVRLAIEEFPYDRIVSKAIGGNFKELHGIYHLLAHPGGLSLRYEGSFTPDFSVPPLIGTLLMRNTVEKRFAAMVHEIEKTRRREPAPAVR